MIPLISIIIPCYNQGHFLPNAIDSVLSQTFQHTEIVVVDDGSTDNTKAVAESYGSVKYIYQPNKGLAASRNTGTYYSTGAYIVFLDADDWLYPDALETNLKYLQQNPQAVFVSGAFDNVFIDDNLVEERKQEVFSDYYRNLLQGNYIAMIAAVMYRRAIFDEFIFDVSLKACEDYDLYLKITRKYPVFHHTEKIAAYRRHSSNMSGRVDLMLSSALKVLGKQKHLLSTNDEKLAFKYGHKVWKKYFCVELYLKIKSGKTRPTCTVLMKLLRYHPSLFIKSILFTALHRFGCGTTTGP